MENTVGLRDNLLVTLGCRAGAMDAMGCIELPSGVEGEDELADLAVKSVRWFTEREPDISFDEYIETILLSHYGKEN